MNETIQALKDSIKHWENLRDGKEKRLGAAYCALCGLFQRAHPTLACEYCPVKKKTGESMCRNTPYPGYEINRTPENAQKEVDFLKDILTEELERPGKVSTAEEKKPDEDSWVDITNKCDVFGEVLGERSYVKFKHDGYFVCTIKIDQEGSYINGLPPKYKVSLNPFSIHLRKE